METQQYFGAAQTEDSLPASLLDQPLVLNREQRLATLYPELKDPSIVKHPSGFYMLYASIGNSITQKWRVGRFVATHPQGVWTELSPVTFKGICGPELCAPAVLYDTSKHNPWQMFIQTSCFTESGVIAHLESKDGAAFEAVGTVVDSEICQKNGYSVSGVYDAGISKIQFEEQSMLCMPFSGYRHIGCGDVYLTTRNMDREIWTVPVKILDQDEVAFHNSPGSPDFEWGLEGVTIQQLRSDLFAMIGVAFLEKPNAFGTRQRVFVAASDKLFGPYKALGPLFNTDIGENGHPDMWIESDKVYVVYQTRLGDRKPWTLRWSIFNADEFINKLSQNIGLPEGQISLAV